MTFNPQANQVPPHQSKVLNKRRLSMQNYTLCLLSSYLKAKLLFTLPYMMHTEEKAIWR